jgi:hypothetical protein
VAADHTNGDTRGEWPRRSTPGGGRREWLSNGSLSRSDLGPACRQPRPVGAPCSLRGSGKGRHAPAQGATWVVLDADKAVPFNTRALT